MSPTNPEQVDCPTCEGKKIVTHPDYADDGPFTCPDCHGTGKVAANVNTAGAQGKLNVNKAAKPEVLDKVQPKITWEIEGKPATPQEVLAYLDESPAPAPIDQPDVLRSLLELVEVSLDNERWGDKDTINFTVTRRFVDEDKARALIAREREVAADETAKAFGGCTKCYGKGYATWRHGETYRGVTSNMRNDIKYCTCDRGQQLAALDTPAGEGTSEQELIASRGGSRMICATCGFKHDGVGESYEHPILGELDPEEQSHES